MYPSIRDLFVYVLGHAPERVRTEPPGDAGAADVEVNLPRPGGDPAGSLGLPALVVEAKDEHDVCFPARNRDALFATKRKYITFATRWFVLVDPVGMVARPVHQGQYGTGDLEFRWDEPGGETAFRSTFAPLSADRAGFDDLLRRFRSGDTALLATLRLGASAAPNTANHQFFDALADAAAALQHATRAALEAQRGHVRDLLARRGALATEFGAVTVTVDPVRVEGGAPEGPDATRAYRRAVARFERDLERQPRLARLAFKALPETAARTGLTAAADEPQLLDVFAAETASLILARVLLVRFFEDHGFFGTRRYVCNGGVEAFRRVMDYFQFPYMRLLENAYEHAAEFYAAAFADTDLDWVLDDASDVLSRALEWAMFLLSQYDFRTVRGDVLSNTYERFISPKQRKAFGEVYTPPTIARFILEHVGVRQGDRLLDPACGSGTFLVEAYESLVGDAAARGIATWRDAKEVLATIAGNDKNRFSAILTQIQLLWHVLQFRQEIAEEGFPDLQVVEGADSLTVRNLMDEIDRFAEVDVQDYAAVVGNPPYVRSERQRNTMDRTTRDFYAEAISPDTNLYALFLYRALGSWCRPEADGVAPGRVGFILPQALCDANEQEGLRTLFAPGGRWRIVELVDLETIGPEVFDADVVPMILIAERRPPRDDDEVIVRVPDADALLQPPVPGARAQFNLDATPAQRLPYASIFAPDGRILSRITPARRAVLDTLYANPTIESAARRYWVRRGPDNRLAEATTDATRASTRRPRWEERRMLGGGVAFRGTHARAASGGVDVYKGENVVSLGLVGQPSHPATDLTAANDPALWRFPNVLPPVAYAIPVIEQLPNVVRFDPRAIAFTNTVTVFAPREELEHVPFDLVLHSRVYRFAYAVGYRMGVLFRRRSHLYPENVRQLPWSDALAAAAGDVEALRAPLTAAYQLLHERAAALRDVTARLGLRRLRDVVRERRDVSLEWAAFFSDAGRVTPITQAASETTGLAGDARRVAFGGDLFDYVIVHGDPRVADWMAAAFRAQEGQRLTREEMLDMPTPGSDEQATALAAVLDELALRDAATERDALLDRLDAIVGPALGLSDADVAEIQRDLREDPFLRTLGVREPFTATRVRGVRGRLARSDRYE